MTLSLRIALLTFASGFFVVGLADAYRFFSTDYLRPSSDIVSYVGVAASALGFYLMFDARHELDELHVRNVLRARQSLVVAFGIYLAAAVAISTVGLRLGASDNPIVPLWAVAAVGAALALSLGYFFLSVVLLVHRFVGRWASAAAWCAFAWSLGVAILAGVSIAEQLPALAHEFFEDPLLLAVSYVPLAFVMTPLFVTFLLLGAVYLEAERNVAHTWPVHRVRAPWKRHA